ncbi:hypothetical protein ElyMa_002556200 [Elysia marginata]|uniref:Uncharacterized protein n=1 Tax=Elysia marginata TaxID=1093978 RepID=A0AAV4GVR4_9GAST|nr:hypothetical protein ElyMa_002556200 [Elysia marginata]
MLGKSTSEEMTFDDDDNDDNDDDDDDDKEEEEEDLNNFSVIKGGRKCLSRRSILYKVATVSYILQCAKWTQTGQSLSTSYVHL